MVFRVFSHIVGQFYTPFVEFLSVHYSLQLREMVRPQLDLIRQCSHTSFLFLFWLREYLLIPDFLKHLLQRFVQRSLTIMKQQAGFPQLQILIGIVGGVLDFKIPLVIYYWNNLVPRKDPTLKRLLRLNQIHKVLLYIEVSDGRLSKLKV